MRIPRKLANLFIAAVRRKTGYAECSHSARILRVEGADLYPSGSRVKVDYGTADFLNA